MTDQHLTQAQAPSPEELAAVRLAVEELRATHPDAWVSADGLYRIRESDLARMLDRSTRTLRNWREEGSGPAFYAIAGRITYALPDVLEWMRTRRCENS